MPDETVERMREYLENCRQRAILELDGKGIYLKEDATYIDILRAKMGIKKPF